MTPIVSVCVPTYNGEAYLASTLQSIAAQTFDDYEVLIVDDLSTDGTVAIAEEYAERDSRVRVVRNSARAGSSARNANECVQHARGTWVKFLFQDDLMAPECLARMVQAGQRGSLVIAAHDYLFMPGISDASRRFYETLPTLCGTFASDYAGAEEVCDALLAHWNLNFIGPTSSSMIRRDCFDRYGPFSPDILTFPDLEYWVRVGNQEGVAIAREPLVSFRVHGGSVSAGLRGNPTREYRNSLEPVLLLLKLGHDPQYERVRQRSRQANAPLDFPQALLTVARDARWQAHEQRFRKKDDAWLAEWDAFCARNPAVLDVLREADANDGVWTKLRRWAKVRL